MKKIITALFVSMSMAACVSVDASDTVSKKTELSIPGVPNQIQGIPVPPITVDKQEPVDLSDTLKSFKDIGEVSLAINNNHFEMDPGSNFAFFDHIAVKVNDLVILDHDFTDAERQSNAVDIPSQVDGTALYQALSSGPATVDFSFTVSGPVPAGDTHLTNTLTLQADVKASKSLGDLGSKK